MYKNFYIYLITNKITNKKYIGSRVDYEGSSELDNYMGSCTSLNKDYIIYGIENFKKEIIKEYIFIDKIHMLNTETEYILRYNTLSPNGYNRHKPNLYPSFHMIGNKHTKKAKEKISKSLKGNKYALGNKWNKDQREKIIKALSGKKRTKETIEKIQKSNIGKKRTDETREKLKISHIGKNYSKKIPIN